MRARGGHRFVLIRFLIANVGHLIVLIGRRNGGLAKEGRCKCNKKR